MNGAISISTFTGDSDITTCAISPENIIVAGEKSDHVHLSRTVWFLNIRRLVSSCSI